MTSKKKNLAIYNLAYQANDNGDLATAEKYFMQALALFTNDKDTEMVINTEISLGNVRYNKGKFESAEESWIHAMKLAAQIKDFNNAGKQAVEIGNLHLEQNEMWGAGYYFRKAEALFLQANPPNTSYLGMVYFKLGNVCFLMQMLDKCLEYLTKALQSFQAEGDQAMEGDVYLALGELFVTKHELEHAKDSFRTAFDIYSKLEKKSEERNQAARSLEKVIQELKTEALHKKFQKMQHVIQQNNLQVSFLEDGMESENDSLLMNKIAPELSPSIQTPNGAPFLPGSGKGSGRSNVMQEKTDRMNLRNEYKMHIDSMRKDPHLPPASKRGDKSLVKNQFFS